MKRAVLALLVLALLVLAACSSGPRGLGRGACPYLRPRLIRVDVDRAEAPARPAATDLGAVAADIAAYVRTNLPDGGRATSDRPLVAFSRALSAYSRDTSRSSAPLVAAERPVEAECRVTGY